MQKNMQAMSGVLERWCEKILPKLMMIFLVLTVTSAVYCGFFTRWAFRDGNGAFGVEMMLDETAHRPFVYRQIIPQTAKLLREALPEPAQKKISERLLKKQPLADIYGEAEIPEQFVIEYHFMYILCYLSFFVAIWILRSILTEVLADGVAGTLGALLFALIVPMFEVKGGYFYDFPELMFFFAAVRFALHGQWKALLLLTPFAAWNKESFVFFAFTLFPLLETRLSRKKALLIAGAAVIIAGCAYLPVHFAYAGNDGGTTEWHLFEHLSLFFSLGSWWHMSTIYGMAIGDQMFFPHILYVFWIVTRGWRKLDPRWQFHAKIAAILTVPLYWLFCTPGELRNLSFLYPAFAVLLGMYLRMILHRAYLSGKK